MAELLISVAYNAAMRAAEFYVWLSCLVLIGVLLGLITINAVAPE